MASPVCPCGTGKPFDDCCAPIHRDPCCADTPEALMRARFSAFVRHDTGVLLATWDPATRPAATQLAAPGPRWLRLDIEGSDSRDGLGWVRFRALGREHGSFLELVETSRFHFDGDACQWFYHDGDAQWQRLTIGRNAPCPCDSGLKAKRCCARD